MARLKASLIFLVVCVAIFAGIASAQSKEPVNWQNFTVGGDDQYRIGVPSQFCFVDAPVYSQDFMQRRNQTDVLDTTVVIAMAVPCSDAERVKTLGYFEDTKEWLVWFHTTPKADVPITEYVRLIREQARNTPVNEQNEKIELTEDALLLLGGTEASVENGVLSYAGMMMLYRGKALSVAFYRPVDEEQTESDAIFEQRKLLSKLANLQRDSASSSIKNKGSLLREHADKNILGDMNDEPLAELKGEDRDYFVGWKRALNDPRKIAIIGASLFSILLVWYGIFKLIQKYAEYIGRTCIIIYRSRIFRASVSLLIIWTMILFMTNGFQFYNMPSLDFLNDAEGYALLFTPSVFVVVAYYLFRWVRRA